MPPKWKKVNRMSKKWIKAAGIRAIKTMAQTAVALIGTGAVGIFDVDWIGVLSASVLAGVLSILTSVAGLPEVNDHEEMMMDKPELEDNYWGDKDDE